MMVAARRRRSWWARFLRLLRYRLVVPIKRSQHPPEYTARGVAVGVAWALTPTVGIQMPLCLVTWGVTRRLFNWDFNVIIALAWTWVTNVVTLLPTYYIFYVTGQLLLGHTGDLSGYDEFVGLWHANVGEDGFGAEGGGGFWADLWIYTEALVIGWGLPMLLGCIPWAVAGTWLGYRWSLSFVVRHREQKERNRAARARGEEAHSMLSNFIHEHDPFHRHEEDDGGDGARDKRAAPGRNKGKPPKSG